MDLPIPFQWEQIESEDTSNTFRAKVPGGWLVNVTMTGRGTMMMTTNFVSDINWDWKVKPM